MTSITAGICWRKAFVEELAREGNDCTDLLGTGEAGGTKGKTGHDKDSISDQWIDFLLKQAQAAGAEADESQAPSGGGPSPNSGSFQQASRLSLSAGEKVFSMFTLC